MTLVITAAAPPAVHVRPLRPDDGAAIIAMHDRCSDRTRYQRWHGHVRSFPSSYLAALLECSPLHLSVVAERDGAVVGLASAARRDEHAAELGALVEDKWQRQGIGGHLLAALVSACSTQGVAVLVADVLVEDAGLLDALRGLGTVTTQLRRGVVHASVRLRAS